MSERDKGGAAFPYHDPVRGQFNGMTLRDWFAGQALAGLLANSAATSGTGYTPAMAAGDAYATADKMLEARK